MRILIIKTSALGDVVHTFPVIHYLHSRFPAAEIDWVVENQAAELVGAHPYVERVLTIQTKRWRREPFAYSSREERKQFRKKLKEVNYDLVFDLQGNLKSSWLLAQVHAQEKIGFGWTSVAEWPNALFTSSRFNPPKGNNIREDYLSVVQSYFNDPHPFEWVPLLLKISPSEEHQLASLACGTPPPVLVCPGAAWPNKCLPIERLFEVLHRLQQAPYLFAWGTETERRVAEQLAAKFPDSHLLERLSLPLLQHVMAKCRLVIAMDSLPLHLCGTISTPSLSFFGPTSSQKYRPLGKHHISYQGSCPYGMQFEKRCPKIRSCKTALCMKGDQFSSSEDLLLSPENRLDSF